MSTPTIYELVRRDLLARERQDIEAFGAPAMAYQGNEAILDAYDTAIDLACYIRQLIENMTIAPPQPPQPRQYDRHAWTPPEYGQ